MASYQILLVENELLSRELLTNHLKREGFTVELAADSNEALKIISQNRFALAFISSAMGDKKITEIVAGIRTRQKGSLIYILASQAGAYDVDSLTRLGVHDIIVKPFRLEDVKLKMHHALELLALRYKARELTDKLQKLESRLKRCESVGEHLKIPDFSSIELSENQQQQEIRAVGTDREPEAKIPLLPGEKEYRKQRRIKEITDPTIEQILQLDELRKTGVLTEEEFKTKKRELLKRI